MVRDKGGFLITEAQILEQLGNVKDVVKDAEPLFDQVLNQRSRASTPH